MLVNLEATTGFKIRRLPFIPLVGERHYEKGASRARTHYSTGTHIARFGVKRTNHEATGPCKQILTFNYQIAIHLFTVVI